MQSGAISNGTGDFPLVTLIVPTYRRPELLEQCLHSLKGQTFDRFVVLVCDNSPDREAEHVVSALEDERFRYRPRETNLGILGNVIAGFQEARTEFVMEVDDDDILYPRCLERLTEPLLRDDSLVLSFSGLDAIDAHGQLLTPDVRRHFLSDSPELPEGLRRPFEELAITGHVYMVSTLFRRDAVDWFAVPPETATAYDRFVTMAAAEGGRGGYYIREHLVGYRVHASGDALRNEAPQQAGALAALEAFLDRVSPAARPALLSEIARTRIMLVRAHAAAAERREALSAVKPLLSSRYATPLFQLATHDIRRLRPSRLVYSVFRSRTRTRILDLTEASPSA